VNALRVGLDARLYGRGLGIATYIDGLATALSRRDDVAGVVLLGGGDGSVPGVRCVRGTITAALADPRVARRRLADLELDVVHFCANIGWLRRGALPHALTVHDAIFLDARGGTARQLAGRAAMRAVVPRSIAAACSLVTASDVARRDLARLGARGLAFHVCPHGAPDDIEPLDVPRRDVIVFAAADPRKGTTLALRTWETALPELPADARLHLLTAAGLGAQDRSYAVRLPRTEIHGRMRRAELAALLGSARALLHTSRAEGFGLPVLEAMAGGTVVVGGMAPSVQWIAGDALAAGAFAPALVAVCTDDELAARLRSRGLRRAAQFSWAASAQCHMAAYRDAIASGRPGGSRRAAGS
jgi:glycosyltransferase involved in cell wall biosynthesis